MYSTAKSALLCHLSHLHLSCTSAEKFLGHESCFVHLWRNQVVDHFKLKRRDGVFGWKFIKDFPSSRIHKWKRFGPGLFWCITVFFLSYSMFAGAMYWFLVITFFSTSVPLFWSTESVDSVGTTIFTLPKVISSFIFYWYQFDVCLFSNECQQYIFLFFFLFFFFNFHMVFLVHRHVLTQ